MIAVRVFYQHDCNQPPRILATVKPEALVNTPVDAVPVRSVSPLD